MMSVYQLHGELNDVDYLTNELFVQEIARKNARLEEINAMLASINGSEPMRNDRRTFQRYLF